MKATVKVPSQLLDFLLEIMQTTIKKPCRQLLKFKKVKVDGVIVQRPSHELKPGQVVEINREKKSDKRLLGTAKGSLRIHYEDEVIIVAEKPSGLLSIGTDLEKKKTMHALLNDYVNAQNGGRVYVVHRLDRHVAGLMVFAKTLDAQTDIQLNWEFARKKYVALVDGEPKKPEGRIENWLQEISVYKVIVTEESLHAKLSLTEYSTLERMNGKTLLDINLRSGRRHQIRVHLAHIGCPIVGDPVYGTAVPGTKEILLFAYCLTFRHPKTERMVTFKIPLPNWSSLAKKRKRPKATEK